jgi:hypothetical protein
MPRPKADPELVERARELVALGASLGEAAETLGVSKPTIKRWIESPPPAAPAERPASAPPPSLPPAELPAHMKPPEAAPPAAPLPRDPLKMVEHLIDRLYLLLENNSAAGDTRQMGSLAATISKLTVNLRQLLDQTRDAADGVHVSPGEFAAACADLDAKLAARIERGGVIRCADCERELSVALGLGPATDADPMTPTP